MTYSNTDARLPNKITLPESTVAALRQVRVPRRTRTRRRIAVSPAATEAITARD